MKKLINVIVANKGPLARIVLRYGVGLLAGAAVGTQLAANPNVVVVVAAVIGMTVEGVYAYAKRQGWAT